MNLLGVYIHIPFCVRKCDYCDFLSAPSDEKTMEKYVNALIKEIEYSKNKHITSTNKLQDTQILSVTLIKPSWDIIWTICLWQGLHGKEWMSLANRQRKTAVLNNNHVSQLGSEFSNSNEGHNGNLIIAWCSTLSQNIQKNFS